MHVLGHIKSREEAYGPYKWFKLNLTHTSCCGFVSIHLIPKKMLSCPRPGSLRRPDIRAAGLCCRHSKYYSRSSSTYNQVQRFQILLDLLHFYFEGTIWAECVFLLPMCVVWPTLPPPWGKCNWWWQQSSEPALYSVEPGVALSSGNFSPLWVEQASEASAELWLAVCQCCSNCVPEMAG